MYPDAPFTLAVGVQQGALNVQHRSGVTFSWADVQKVQRDGMKKMILLEKIHVIWVKPPVHISQNIFKHQVNYVSPHSVASNGNIR